MDILGVWEGTHLGPVVLNPKEFAREFTFKNGERDGMVFRAAESVARLATLDEFSRVHGCIGIPIAKDSGRLVIVRGKGLHLMTGRLTNIAPRFPFEEIERCNTSEMAARKMLAVLKNLRGLLEAKIPPSQETKLHLFSLGGKLSLGGRSATQMYTPDSFSPDWWVLFLSKLYELAGHLRSDVYATMNFQSNRGVVMFHEGHILPAHRNSDGRIISSRSTYAPWPDPDKEALECAARRILRQLGGIIEK